MSNMKDQIAKTIQENLPTAVMEEYKRYIENAERDAAQLSEARKSLEIYKALCTQKEREIERLQQLNLDSVAISAREQAVAGQERRLALTLAEIKLEQAEKRVAEIKDLAAIAFRNPRLKHFEIGSVPFVTMQNGYPVITTGHSTKSVETTEE